MYGAMQQHLAESARRDPRRRALYKASASSHRRSRRTSASADGADVLNMCANNYLGLADHPEVDRRRRTRRSTTGATAWPRCGSSAARRSSTRSSSDALSEFLGTEDTILYSSCFDANGGLFETLLGAEDAVISDELNHASIIDGIRLCKAQRLRYTNNDMADLEAQAAGRRPGAPLPADRHRRRLLDGRQHRQPRRRSATWPTSYDALVMVDDSHAVGFMGEHGRGTHEHARRDGPRRHHHRHARQGARRRQRRLHQRPRRRSSTCCASGRGRICSRTRSRRRSSARRSRRSSCSSALDRAARHSSRTTRGSSAPR